jgi:ketosteroid isomerase-like protein
VEHEKDRAMRNRDIAVLDQIYTDDLSFVNARGRVITKKEHMDEIQSGKVRYLSSDQSDYHVHAYGDTAVLTGVESSTVDYHGKVLRFPRRFMTVYVRQDGRWRYVAHQVTPVAPQ